MQAAQTTLKYQIILTSIFRLDGPLKKKKKKTTNSSINFVDPVPFPRANPQIAILVLITQAKFNVYTCKN